jgi:hypothetical protein
MSKALAKLLNEPDYKLGKVITKLESLSGHQSLDIRILADNQGLLRTKISSLGLDPDDTTSQELQLALTNKLKADVRFIHGALKIAPSDPVENSAAKVLALASQCSSGHTALSIKTATARRLLKTQPPKKLMKLLKYRGLESMLKREDPRKLFALVPAAESAGWNERINAEIKKLTNRDFEMRPVEFLIVKTEPDAVTRVAYAPLMGVVVVLPGKDISQRALEICYQMLQAEEILQADTFYLKSHQMAGDFSSRASLILKSAEPPMIKVAGHEFIKWHHLKNLFGKHTSLLERFAKIHPALNWWREAANLAQAEGSIVSLHIGDVFKAVYGRNAGGISLNLKESLKTSLVDRYAQAPAVKSYILQQLDDKVITLDPALGSEALSPGMHSEFI